MDTIRKDIAKRLYVWNGHRWMSMTDYQMHVDLGTQPVIDYFEVMGQVPNTDELPTEGNITGHQYVVDAETPYLINISKAVPIKAGSETGPSSEHLRRRHAAFGMWKDRDDVFSTHGTPKGVSDEVDPMLLAYFVAKLTSGEMRIYQSTSGALYLCSGDRISSALIDPIEVNKVSVMTKWTEDATFGFDLYYDGRHVLLDFSAY